jgi:iron complex transport system substrate-binding protein
MNSGIAVINEKLKAMRNGQFQDGSRDIKTGKSMSPAKHVRKKKVQGRRIFCAVYCIAALWMPAIFGGCNSQKTSYQSEPSAAATAAVASNSAAITPIRYAKGFTLEQRPGYKLLRVLTPWRDAKTTYAYALVPRGTKAPQIEPGAELVETPVQRIILASTTFVVHFATLGLEDTIVGISGGKTVNTHSIAARIKDGRIQEVGNGTMSADSLKMERLINLQPELVMVYGTGNPQYDQQDKLREAGFHVAVNSEYMESTPLGRTEWIKFIAAFFNKEAEADRLFTAMAARYEMLAAKTRMIASKPTVFCNSNFRGSWHMPGGKSYMAAFFRDAGANYLWNEDTSTGSIPMNVESVLARAKDADLWLNPGTETSLEELAAEDERYSVFRAFRTGRVFNNDALMDAGGGSDFWETGVANPDKILADLISIIHPDILPEHRRIWYRQLPEKTIERK